MANRWRALRCDSSRWINQTNRWELFASWTDAQGHFRLSTSDDRPGAVVGQHAVRISTLKGRRIPNSESTEITTPEKLPERFNTQTQLQFTVPEQGTDKADFDLKS